MPRAMWYESSFYETREEVPRTEEYETSEWSSPIRYEDVDLNKAKYIADGIDIKQITRVIKVKNNISFKTGDRIEFIDETYVNGEPINLIIESIKFVVPVRYKKQVEMFPKMKQFYSEKILYLQ